MVAVWRCVQPLAVVFGLLAVNTSDGEGLCYKYRQTGQSHPFKGTPGIITFQICQHKVI